jgi:lysophospholipase L1-like esterase
MDYDHNAPNAEFLAKTHYPLYKNFRKSHPKTPIIMMTMPTVAGYEGKTWQAERKKVIFENYNRAKANGDDNLYLVDCYGCFGDLVKGECGTVDDSHPDSLGFLRMAERVYPILDKILNNK